MHNLDSSHTGHGLVGLEMKLRYSISLKSQVIYIHGKKPEFLYVEFESGYPHIWCDVDPTQPHYPHKFEIYQSPQRISGLIQSINDEQWYFYYRGPGSTSEFNKQRWPNKAPMPLNKTYKETQK